MSEVKKEYDPEMRGALYEEAERKSDKSPIATGKITISGVELRIERDQNGMLPDRVELLDDQGTHRGALLPADLPHRFPSGIVAVSADRDRILQQLLSPRDIVQCIGVCFRECGIFQLRRINDDPAVIVHAVIVFAEAEKIAAEKAEAERIAAEKAAAEKAEAERIAAEKAAAEKAEAERIAAEKAAIRYHTVKSGDTLGAIAKRYGKSLSTIQKLNPGVNSNKLRIGQKIRVN